MEEDQIDVNMEDPHESGSMDSLWTPGGSSAQRGRKTYAQGQ
jgi:hypothetical protein